MRREAFVLLTALYQLPLAAPHRTTDATTDGRRPPGLAPPSSVVHSIATAPAGIGITPYEALARRQGGVYAGREATGEQGGDAGV
jgi:hypothetical protein